MQLERNYIEYVKQTIDKLVTETKFPVATKVLEEVGIADRSKLRKLERMGILKRMQITTGNGNINAYFTEDVLPKYEIERRARLDAQQAEQERLLAALAAEQTNAGEGGKEGQYTTENPEQESGYATVEASSEGYSSPQGETCGDAKASSEWDGESILIDTKITV